MSTRRRVEPNFLDKYRLEEGWFSFLALLLAYMTVVWSIQASKWVDGSYLLPQAALVSFLIGFGLSKVRFVPSLLAHSFMISVGMVFIGLLVGPFTDDRSSGWSQKLGSTVLRVVRWCESAIAGKAHDDNLVYLVMLSFGLWLLGYSVAWVLFRGHKVWWSLLMLGSVLMVNLSFNPPGAFGSFTFFLIVALLLVVRFNAFMDEQRWRSLRLYFQPGIWRGAMMVGSCLVLVVVAVAFATPSSSQIAPLGDVLNTVSQPFNGIKGIWDSVGTGTGDGKDKVQPLSKGNYNALQDSFTIGGPLRLSNDPYFRVVSADPHAPPSYMQVVALDQYDGTHWINTFQVPPGPIKTDDALFRRLSLAANQSLPTSTDQGRNTQKLTVTSLVPGFTPIISMGDLVSADHASLVAFHYQKVTINSPLDAFILKDIPDGNGGKRSVLVDDTTGQAVPPALLDLIKYLKDGTQLEDLAYPPSVTANYTEGGRSSIRINGSVDRRNPNVSVNYTKDNWSYQLPTLAQLQAMGLLPGGSPVSNKVKVIATYTPNPSRTVELDSTVYLQSSGGYILNLESPLAKGNQAQTRFDATDAGKQVLAEIKKLQEAVKGNKASYTLSNGKPISLQYDGYEPNYDDLTEALLPQPINPGDGYSSYSRRYGADIESLRKAQTDYPVWVYSRYLQLPENLPEAIKAQALELTAGAKNNYDKTMAIVSYLNTLTYSTDPPPVPEGRDQIEYFLTESKSGYCVHYSSSLALMLRTLGIPSRIVNGYIGGDFDSASNAWIVRGNAAHSWTQVYFKGIGWVDFEATPGKESIERPADPSSVPPQPLVTPPPADNGSSSTLDGSNLPDILGKNPPKKGQLNPDGSSDAVTTSLPSNDLLLWLAGVLGLAMIGGGLFVTRRMYVQRRFAIPDPSPLVVYNRMSLQAKKIGLRGRTGMTPNEYAAYLNKQLPLAAPSVEAITRAYVRRRYGPEGADLYEVQRQMRLSAVVEAEKKLEAADLSGHDARPEDLWQAFKAHTEVYKDDKQIGEVWETYQEAIISYRRTKRLEKLTPRFLPKVRTEFERYRRKLKFLK